MLDGKLSRNSLCYFLCSVGYTFQLLGTGSNHCALERIRDSSRLRELLVERGISLGAYANRLTAVDPEWTMEGSDGPQPMRDDLPPDVYYEKFVSNWINDLNVQIVGGCCGITPEHIAYLRSKLRPDQP